MTTEPTVIIVDDDAAFLESLSVLLRSVGLRSQGFSSSEEFLEHFDPSLPGCIILDVRMPGRGGLELQERLAREPSCPPILILTGHAEVPVALRAMRQGAVDFLQKTCSEAELLGAINRAIARDTEQREARAWKEAVRARVAMLTRAEKEVLEHVLMGLPNKNIASALRISQRAVEDRRAKIMRKLNVNNLPDLVRLAMEAGLMRNE